MAASQPPWALFDRRLHSSSSSRAENCSLETIWTTQTCNWPLGMNVRPQRGTGPGLVGLRASAHQSAWTGSIESWAGPEPRQGQDSAGHLTGRGKPPWASAISRPRCSGEGMSLLRKGRKTGPRTAWAHLFPVLLVPSTPLLQPIHPQEAFPDCSCLRVSPRTPPKLPPTWFIPPSGKCLDCLVCAQR